MDRDIKLKLKELIGENRIKEVIEELKNSSSAHKTLFNSVVLCSSRLADVEQKYNVGIIELGNYNIEVSKIRNSLLNYIDEIFSNNEEKKLTKKPNRANKNNDKYQSKQNLLVQSKAKEFISFILRILHTGTDYDIEVPYDMITKVIREQIIDELKLDFKMNEYTIGTKLTNKTNGKTLDDNLTFRENQVNNGDILFLTAQLIAG